MELHDKATILVVDDTPANISILLRYLEYHQFKVLVARDGDSAIKQAKFTKPDLILLDVMMPGMDGFETCKRLKDDVDTKDIPVLFITALTDTVDKVKGLRIGAVDYITKPIKYEELLARVTTHLKICALQGELESANSRLEDRVAEQTAELLATNRKLKSALSELQVIKNQLQAENIYLKEEIKREYDFDELVCESDGFNKVINEVKRIAPTDATVLILGETGTGKELIARAIHNASLRRERALVTVNCAALPANLIESELFGHEKGAFTGATRQKIGRFELADGGTIFLDEIGDLPFELQAKLLRVLQEAEFERLGNPNTIKVDIRILAATNKDLRSAVKDGEFREDLYYRLSVIPISLPPLRERVDDIPSLVRHFMHRNCTKLNKRIDEISTETIGALQQYSWPGNIRELENVVERAVILSDKKCLQIDEFMDHLDLSSPASPDNGISPTSRRYSARMTLEDAERNHIIHMLDDCEWVVEGRKGAASALGINPSTLRSKMRKLRIRKS